MTTISKPNLQMFLRSQGIDDSKAFVFTPASTYCFPTKAWVAGKFSTLLRERQVQNGMDRYDVTANNCRTFTRYAAAFASELHYRTTSRPNAILMFGEVYYRREFENDDHVINITAYCRNGVPKELLYYEAQTCRLVYINPASISAILL